MATTEAIDVVMPQMGVSVSEGTITKWLKQEGEQVEADEPLLEISTDKVDTEVPSPGSGTLSQILVQEGQTVEVGTKLAVIGGAAPPRNPRLPPPSPPWPSLHRQPPPPSPSPRPPSRFRPRRRRTARLRLSGGRENRVRARRRPDERPGTGRGGRVTKKDILSFIESGPPTAAPEPAEAAAPEAPVAPEAPPAAPPAPAPVTPPPPAPVAPTPAPAPAMAQAAQPQPVGDESFEPMTAMRKGIADHMRRSLDTSAHVTSAIEVDMSQGDRDPREAQEGVPGRATESTRPT